jgi:hypothetical protein
MKVKCPICATWLTKKSINVYWNYETIHNSLVCNNCVKKQGYSFRVELSQFYENDPYSSLTMSFLHKKFYCSGIITNYKNNKIDISFYVQSKLYGGLEDITYRKKFSFNDLCDQNIDILDYNEVYWLFKKEACRWAKLQLFS